MSEQVSTGASDLRKRYWQEHGRPPEGEGPHPDRGGPAYIPWLEALVAQLEVDIICDLSSIGNIDLKPPYIMWELREEQFNLIVDLLKSINKGIKDLDSVIELLKSVGEK